MKHQDSSILDLEEAIDKRLDEELVDLAIPPSYKKTHKRTDSSAIRMNQAQALEDGATEPDIPVNLTEIDSGPVVEDLIEKKYPLSCCLIFLSVSGHLLSCIFWSLVVNSLCTSQLKQCIIYGVLLLISYIMIFTEAFNSRTRAFVRNYIDYETFENFLTHIKMAPPICSWEVICYDIERKKRSADMEIQRHKDVMKFEHNGSTDYSDEFPRYKENSLMRVGKIT